MKLIRPTLLTLLLLESLVTCKQVDGPAHNIFQTWEVKEFVSIESKAYSQFTNSPIYLTIKNDGTYFIQLDVNQCRGNILNITDLSIVFDPPACSEACCDSPFAKHFEEMLPYISMYKVLDNILRLSVRDWGFIECELVQD